MKRPWWLLRSAPDDDGGEDSSGEPGPGKRLIVTHRDSDGDPDEWAWADDEAAAHWDERVWRSSP